MPVQMVFDTRAGALAKIHPEIDAAGVEYAF